VVFGPADLEVPGEDVRGFLSYRPESPVTGSIVVLIEGLRSPFQEAVDLPRDLLL